VFVKRSTRNLPLTITFEGVRGDSFAGDIALDDVSFARNACPLPRMFLNNTNTKKPFLQYIYK